MDDIRADELVAEAAKSIVAIRNANREAIGSGVVVAPHIVATNAHILQGNKGVLSVGAEDTFHTATIRSGRWFHDLVLLDSPTLTAPAIKLGASRTLKKGEPVIALEATDKGIKSNTGVIQHLDMPAMGDSLIMSSAYLQKSKGGGALINDKGALVGLKTFPDIGNAAIPSRWISELQRVKVQGGFIDPPHEPPQTEIDWYMKANRDAKSFAEWAKARPNSFFAQYAYGLQGLTAPPQQRQTYATQIERALAIYDKDPAAWGRLGEIYHIMGDYQRQGARTLDTPEYKKAATAYNKAAEIVPDNPYPLRQAGIVLTFAGKFTAAIRTLEMATQLGSRSEQIDSLNALAKAYQGNGNRKKAVDAYRRAFNLTPVGQREPAHYLSLVGHCEELAALKVAEQVLKDGINAMAGNSFMQGAMYDHLAEFYERHSMRSKAKIARQDAARARDQTPG